MAEIYAAGAVLWRPAGPAGSAGLEVAVVHRPRYDDWSLPKGKLERGETLWACAAREVAEETGFSTALGRFLGRVSYPLTHPLPATKFVDYVVARARGGRFLPNREVDELRWLAPGDAANLLSYDHDRHILREFLVLPADTTQVLLVRHATAGDRKRWPGPDDLRPLTAKGWKQVKAVRTLLPLFGVDRVHAAPLLRCVQTVQQVADDIGGTITDEPLLSERGYAGHERAAVDRLRELAVPGTTPAVCSQGGVIPDLLSRLTGPAMVAHAESVKGSVWLLSFTQEPRPDLAAARYIPKP